MTEFVSTVNKTGEDYNTLTLWEAAMDDIGSLTVAANTSRCGSWDTGVGSVIADATAVTWDAAARTGTLIHQTSSNGYGTDQYLIKCTLSSDCTALGDNDVVTDGTNSFQPNGAPDNCIITAHFYNDDGSLDDKPVIFGFTTNSTNYVRITSPVGERHTGILNTGAKIDTSTAGLIINIAQASTHIDFIEINGDATNSTSDAIIDNAGVDGIILDSLLIQGDEGENRGLRNQAGFTIKISNTLFYKVGANGRSAVETSGGSTLRGFNITIFDGAGVGFEDVTGTSDIRNSGVFSTTQSAFSNLETGEVNNCISSDGTADDFGGSGDQVNKSSYANYFINQTTNFHLLNENSVLYHAGADLSANANYSFNTDVDSQTRAPLWDVGADEFTEPLTAIQGSSFEGSTLN